MNRQSYYLWRSEAGPEPYEVTVAAEIAGGSVTDVADPAFTYWPVPDGRVPDTGVVVCPGGGYECLCLEHEGAAIARWLNSLGIAAFVLRYRVPPPSHEAPLQDVLRAMRMIRSGAVASAEGLRHLGVLGASAGGHVAGMAGTCFNDPEGVDASPIGRFSGRPDFVVLLYPVVTLLGPSAHLGSRKALLGASPTMAIAERLSVERRVTADASPTFLVHALNDTVVPAANSLLLNSALKNVGVPTELLTYYTGYHGFGLGRGQGEVSQWPRRCEDWLRTNGHLATCSFIN